MAFDLIELCAGTGAVSYAAVAAPRFPASRIGSKTGYVTPIFEALGIRTPIDTALLVEADERLTQIHAALASDPDALADALEERLSTPAERTWREARLRSDPASCLLTLAGARGGVGGFKGLHKLRPNVDGFIPSRQSLIKRVRAFAAHKGKCVTLQADVTELDPEAYAPTRVYCDPPYQGRQGYDCALGLRVEILAQRWRSAGHLVVVSEARPLPGADSVIEITSHRRGQNRRSLTHDAVEWLSIFGKAPHA